MDPALAALEPPLLFLTIFAKQEPSYFIDSHVSALAGALREAGVRADVAEAYARPGDAAYLEALLARARAFVEAGGYRRVLVSRAWDRALLDALAAATTSPRVEPLDRLEEDVVRAAFVSARLAREPLPDEALADPVALLLEADPVLDVQVINDDFRPARRWLTLVGDESCVYRRDVRRAPGFAGCPLPTDGSVHLSGCAFCRLPKERPRRRLVTIRASLERQALRLARAGGGMTSHDLVLVDQAPFAYLGWLVDRLAEQGFGGSTLHVQARVDVMLAGLGRFERALDRARQRGLRLSPYLIGIESFSDAELQTLHKGTTAAQNERLLAELDRLAAAWPDALSTEGWSFGFLLWTPWTTLADLWTNLEAMRRVGMTRFRGDEILTKLRLTPDVALTHRAAAEGLLLEAWAYAFLSNAVRWGYDEEIPWRFADLRVQRAAEIVFSEYEGLKPVDQYAFLELALRFAQELEGEGLRGETHAARVAAFHRAYGDVIDALVRSGRRGGGDRAASPAPELVTHLARLLGRLPVAEVELAEELRVHLKGGLTLTLRLGGRGPALAREGDLAAGYQGEAPDLARLRAVLKALLGRLAAWPEDARAALAAALGSGIRLSGEALRGGVEEGPGEKST